MPTLENVVVQSKARNGKGIKVDDQWYGAFSAGQLADVDYKDTITFTYTEKHPAPGSSNPRVYLNIQGAPTVTSKGEGAGDAVSTSTPRATAVGFPVAATAKDRSIVRQNSLGHAVKVVLAAQQTRTACAPAELVTEILEIAQCFEAYSCGDVERMEAEAVLEKMKAA